ncbi:MAG: hypothetical protein U1C33_02065 [Candidatus Cloacimonadaceae bacterium]|nr:hypothetical protein [Candidatus Cloacimonadaceae bacterium]
MIHSSSSEINFSEILNMIGTKSEIGGVSVQRYTFFAPPKLETVLEDYARIAVLMQFYAKHQEVCQEMEDDLAHVTWIHTKKFNGEQILEPHDLFELKQFIYFHQKIRKLMLKYKLPSKTALADLQELFTYLDPDGHKIPTFRLSPAYSQELNSTFEALYKSSLALKHQVQKRLLEARKAMQISTLKEEIVVSRLQKMQIDRLKDSEFYRISSENAANISFSLSDTAEIQELRATILEQKEELRAAEEQVLISITAKVAEYQQNIRSAFDNISLLDWDFSRALFGIAHQCIIPTHSDRIILKKARNLHLMKHLSATQRTLQAIDIELSPQVNILTGPNMGGKTTALQTIGQCSLMFRLGIPIPASAAAMPFFDFVWFNHDDRNKADDLSSFGRETVAFVNALAKKGRGLILLDEFAKGTNPSEGEAIASAVLQYLMQEKHTVLAATHYSAPTRIKGITQFAIKGFGSKVFASLKSNKDIPLDKRLTLLSQAMDYNIIRLTKKQNPPLCALSIAEILGLDEKILALARDFLE